MKVVSPRSLEDALATLADAGASARCLAGGTDLFVEMESGRTRPDLVVDLSRVPALRAIRATSSGVEIGALATCSELMRNAAIAAHAPVLAQAAAEVGAVQIQNRATIGGNLGTASPAADLVPVLFALGARVRLRSRGGTRELVAPEFVRGYRDTARRLDELIECVVLPVRERGERQSFRKVGTRRAQSIAKVVVALSLVVDEAGRVVRVRAAAGSVAEKTIRLAHFERALGGELLDPERVRAAAALAAQRDARPKDDVRSTAEYRRTVLARVLARMIGTLRNSEEAS